MGRYLVPIAIAAAMAAMAVAALTVAFVPGHPAWWEAAVRLAVLGGITPMIEAVNIRLVPVFSRRQWPSLPLLRVMVGLSVTGAWLVWAARLGGSDRLEILGHAAAFGSGLAFMASVIGLFRSAPTGVASPIPYPGQVEVDKIAIRFTRIAGMYLELGLLIGLITAIWQPDRGRWDLVWAHTMLVGFFLSMASGVSYHVLARWTTRQWPEIRPIQLHMQITTIALPLMLVALALDVNWLFAIAGPLQAAALAIFLGEVVPMIPGLPGATRTAFTLAVGFLLIGIALGATFAIDPTIGGRLRMAHAEINLFGFAGLLISGVGAYLVPRFAGRIPRWPRLVRLQLWLIATGCGMGAISLGLRAYGHDLTWLIVISQSALAAGLAIFGIVSAATFAGRPGAAVQLGGSGFVRRTS